MDQYLLGFLVKSHAGEDNVIGAQYDLRVPDVQKIVAWHKGIQKWNWDMINMPPQILPVDFLFEQSGILDPFLRDDAFHYYFDLGNIRNCFTKELPPMHEYKHLCIAARSKLTGQEYFCNFIYREFHDLFLEKFSEALMRQEKIKLHPGDVIQIISDPHFRIFYEFDFEKYDHWIEYRDLWEYIIPPGEEWFKLVPAPE